MIEGDCDRISLVRQQNGLPKRYRFVRGVPALHGVELEHRVHNPRLFRGVDLCEDCWAHLRRLVRRKSTQSETIRNSNLVSLLTNKRLDVVFAASVLFRLALIGFLVAAGLFVFVIRVDAEPRRQSC